MDNENQRINQRNLEKVRDTIARNKQRMSPASAPGGPPVAYPPIGEHVLRLLLDPDGELARYVTVHRQGLQLRTLCPDALRQAGLPGDYPSCALCESATHRDAWHLRPEAMNIFYGHLSATQHPARFWTSGQTYGLVLNAALANTIFAHLLTWMEAQPEPVGAVLNPDVPGPALRLRATRQPTWSLTPTFTGDMLPPIPVGEWYRPLTACWLGPEFNLAEYQSVLAALMGSA